MNYLQGKIRDAYNEYNEDNNLKKFLEEGLRINLDCDNYENYKIASIDLEKMRVNVIDKNNLNHHYDVYYIYDNDFVSDFLDQSYTVVTEYNDNYIDEKIYSTYGNKYYARTITLIDGEKQLIFDRHYCNNLNDCDLTEEYDIVYRLCDLASGDLGQDLFKKKYKESFSDDKKCIFKQEVTNRENYHIGKNDRYDNYCYYTPDSVIYGINSCVNNEYNIKYMCGVCFENINCFGNDGEYKDYLPKNGLWFINRSDDFNDLNVNSKIYLRALDDKGVHHILEIDKKDDKIMGKYTLIDENEVENHQVQESNFVISSNNGNINSGDLMMLNEYLNVNYDDKVMEFFTEEINKFKNAVTRKNIFGENAINHLLNPEILVNLDDDYIKRLALDLSHKFLKEINDEYLLKTNNIENKQGMTKVKKGV